MTNFEISAELKAHFLRLYQIAFSDDHFDPTEMKMLYRFAEERGVDKNALDEILLNPNSVGQSIPDGDYARIEYLYDFARMIWADGKVTEDERTTLRKYCKIFDIVDENIDELSKYLLDCAENNLSKEELLADLK